MKKSLLPILLLLCLFPAVVWMQSNTPTPRLEITGVNPTDLPTAIITANVFDPLGQPLQGLTLADFRLSGALSEVGEIVRVENVSDDNLSFAVVLVIDTSSSMAGLPIERAKAAATAFVNSIGENDPVAIITFDTETRLVQDYTTDKQILLDTIANLRFGGQTDLYNAAVEGILKAAEAPTPRRAMILLSDGAQFGDGETLREAAGAEAAVRGVPIYTIGLGYGTDRTYLQELSAATNARNYESPTPDQLTDIYSQLASLFRSQYVLTLNVPVPLDGTVYEFGLQAVTPFGDTAIMTSTLRAPIPVPLITFENPPTTPIGDLTTITATIRADDETTLTAARLGDAPLEGPFEVIESDQMGLTYRWQASIDPFVSPPGETTLRLTVTDATGDTVSVDQPITIAALPARATIAPDLASLGEIDTPVIVTVTVEEQTPTDSVTFAVDGETMFTTDSAPFEFMIVPEDYSAGEHQLTITLTSESGATVDLDQTFTIAVLPSATPTPTDTFTPTATLTPTPTATPTATIDFAATDRAATLSAQVTLDAQATVDTQTALDQQATIDAQIVLEQQATVDAQATLDQQATIDAQAILDQQATVDAQATLDQQATIDAQAMLDQQATIDAQATLDQQATVDAQATIKAEATNSIRIRQTSTALSMTLQGVPQATVIPPTFTPTRTRTPLPTATLTQTPLPTNTNTATLTRTPRPTATQTATPEPSPTSTNTATPEPSPTITETLTPEPTPTVTETAIPTLTFTPTIDQTLVAQAAQTQTATFDPTSTPVTILEVGSPEPDSTNTLLPIIVALCVGVPLLFLLLFLFRRRNRQP
ncbi:MAG: VWA domain-containing protein [Anaerolineae bacterium]|nr:VWA domain-containing protein [Anaerolineae bacterium]